MKPSTIIAMILSFSVFCAGATLMVHNHLQDLNSETRPHTLYEYDLSSKTTTAQTNSDPSSEESSETETSSEGQSWISTHILHRTTRRQVFVPTSGKTTEIVVISDTVIPSTTTSSEENTSASTNSSTTTSSIASSACITKLVSA